MKKETLNFVSELFTKNKIPYYYTDISNAYGNQTIFKNLDQTTIDADFMVIEDLPRYLNIQRLEKPKNIKSLLLKQYPGFLMNFEGIEDLSDYLKQRFGKSSIYKLRREQRKLEYCFDISYKMYYGEMTKTEYDFIFEEFYKLLEIRSVEKGILKNAHLNYKAEYNEILHKMILEKKASFYVIYNGKKPIDICLNYYLADTVYQYLRTYDIAYSKFNTGYTDLMMQIDWCIKNNKACLVFSKGDFYWKRRWCNVIYDYDYEVFYNTCSLKALITMQKFTIIKRLKQFVRERGIISSYHRYKEQKRKAKLPLVTTKIEILESSFSFDDLSLTKIDYETKNFDKLRRIVFEFLYQYNEKQKDISLFKSNNELQSFYVIGKMINAKLSI
ncbi:GNAT family N-acetyltransferase [Winogradskyella ursingii]|uniref:GNAT family N-acetyltransferase n=1 Tax=Winogradskyella ursingii TaxID=2686079 RepID=UPI0015C83CAE|nr:GNAT family N-acetyltransferase [Winogradskyella ursingii]